MKGAGETVELLVRWGVDVSELNSNGKTAAKVVGKVFHGETMDEADVKRTHQVLATEMIWRRRGVMLLCLAINSNRSTEDRRRSGAPGNGNGTGKEEGRGRGREAGRRAVVALVVVAAA